METTCCFVSPFPHLQNGNRVQGLGRVVILHSGSLQDGAQTPAVLQPSTIQALMSLKPLVKLCHSHSLSPPSLSNATGHVASWTPATLHLARSPSSRSAACSELCKHLASTSTLRPPAPRVHPGLGELTCCSSFQQDEESCKFPWPDLASPSGNFSRALCWEQ